MSRRGHGDDVCAVRELGTWQAIDAYQAAFTTAGAADLAGRGRPAYHVRQAALESVIAERMRINAVISVHRAVLAGASVDELAQAVGVSTGEIAKRWRTWADEQRWMNTQCPGLGVSGLEYARVAAAFPTGPGVGGGCACSRNRHANRFTTSP